MEKIEFIELKAIVDRVFGEDITIKRRTRNLIDARRVFSKILHDRGYTFSSIGIFLKKDHSTIVHYLGDIDFLLKQEQTLLRKYILCRDTFLKDREILRIIKEKDVVSTIFDLQNENEKLLLERDFVLNLKNKYQRLDKIIDLIDNKVRVGNEDKFEKKLNGLLNTLN
jgi:hypothetical protein